MKMSHPETDAKFDGNCKKCGATWKTGDKIYKINQQYWCSNAACPTPVEKPKLCEICAKPDHTIENCPNAPVAPVGNYKDVHDKVWAFAIEEAKKVYPVVMRQVPGDENVHKDINMRERMIVAEVFYKKLMDWHIHRTT